MPSKRTHRVWVVAAVFALTLSLAAFASSTSKPPAVQADPKTDRAAIAVRLLDFIDDVVGSVNQEEAASPHEPSGKPEGRPPDHANNDKDKAPKEGPPGKPPDRPPDKPPK